MRTGSLFSEGTHVEMLRRLRVISGDDMREAFLRIVIAFAVTWVPLLALTALRMTSVSFASFLIDAAAHARFLLAVPLLIAADYVVLPRLDSMARYFNATNLVPPARQAEYDVLLTSCRRLSTGVWPSGFLFVAVYAIVIALAIMLPMSATPLWQRGSLPLGLSRAGWWHMGVSLPVLLGLILAWVWRLGVWVRFLWRMARMDLYLVPAHPDQAGGLQFLAYSPRIFATLALPVSIVVAGPLANKVIAGASPLGHEAMPLMTALVLLLLFGSPPLVFSRALVFSWRLGVFRYGNLASRAGEAFETRWFAASSKIDTDLLECPDFSATTDLYAVVANVYAMRQAIYDIQSLLAVIVATVLPFAPIWLSAIPFNTIVDHLVDALF
jgi:hypothetical protein